MTTFPLSVLADPLKIEELFQKIESRKKLEQMLMDPRVIELSKQSPQSREALAAVVRRLQQERERKRRIRNAEQDEEPVAKWFNCINFLKTFSAPPRQSSRLTAKPANPELRHRNKVTRSSPNLESTALPGEPLQQPTTFLMKSAPTPAMPEMTVCIPPITKDGSLPINLMEFCTSEKGRAMITSLINSTDLKRLFGFKSILPTQSHQLLQCIDCLNSSDLRPVQYYVPRKCSGQRFIVLRSRNPIPQLTFDGHWGKLKSVVSSSTQTVYSGSCSHCSSNCLSIDSFSSYNDLLRDDNVKKNQLEFPIYKNNNIIKRSKSQSAMYTTDYSECDCDDLSSPDEIYGGKYLSRILTKAVVPKINYLTTPDVLVTYSGNGHSSDGGSSSSSCEACKGNISTESFQREPREIWTQKRLKTSCESCLNTFRTELIRKSKYSKEPAVSSYRSGSFGSLSSDEFSQEVVTDFQGIGEEFYAQAKSILDDIGEYGQKDELNRRNEMVMSDVSIYEERMISEAKYDVEMKNINSLDSDGIDVSSMEFDQRQIEPDEKPTESVYESTPQSLAPMVVNSHSYMSVEKESGPTGSEYPKTQLDGGPPPPKDDSAGLQPAATARDRLLINDLLSTSSSGEDSTHAESVGTINKNVRKQRNRVRNKCGSASALSDSSSSSPLPQFRTFPRRLKPKVSPIQTPTTPQQTLLQKISKQKSRKKNCAVM